jgi:hypothetical protein
MLLVILAPPALQTTSPARIMLSISADIVNGTLAQLKRICSTQDTSRKTTRQREALVLWSVCSIQLGGSHLGICL